MWDIRWTADFLKGRISSEESLDILPLKTGPWRCPESWAPINQWRGTASQRNSLSHFPTSYPLDLSLQRSIYSTFVTFLLTPSLVTTACRLLGLRRVETTSRHRRQLRIRWKSQQSRTAVKNWSYSFQYGCGTNILLQCKSNPRSKTVIFFLYVTAPVKKKNEEQG